MNSWRLKLAWVLAGTVVAAGFDAARAQQAVPSSGRKIEFSDPGTSVLVSNLNAISSGKPALTKFELNLKKPNEVLQPGSSLQGIGAPLMPRTPSSIPNSKKLKEILEKRQDWQFLDFEDYHSEQTVEGMLGIPEYGPDGEFKEEKTPLERYYERLERANAPTTNRSRGNTPFSLELGLGKQSGPGNEESKLRGEDNEPAGVAEFEDPLKHLLQGNQASPFFQDKSKPAGFSGIFGQAEPWKPESLEATRAQAARLEEFKRLLDAPNLPSLPSSSLSGIAPLDPFAPVGSTTPTFVVPRNSEPRPGVTTTPLAPGRDSFSPLPTTPAGVIAGPLDLPVIPSASPSLAPTPPLVEPTRTAAPASEFSIPKRRFN